VRRRTARHVVLKSDGERLEAHRGTEVLLPFGNIRCFSFVKLMYLDNF
jgi:hypothetical protein